jgi:hypothetical protein
MAKHLKFRAKDSAEERSRELWAQKLGRPVDANAVTVHLYAFQRSAKRFGGSVLFIHDDGELLTADEKEDLRDDDDLRAWREKYRPEDLETDD